MWGDVVMLVAPDPVLALVRRLDGAVLHAWFNTGNEVRLLDLADFDDLTVIQDHDLVGGNPIGSRVSLPPFGVRFAIRG